MNKTSVELKYKLLLGMVQFGIDQFKIALMNSAFIYNPTASVWSDVSAYELDDINGYEAGGYLLWGQTLYNDVANNKCKVTFPNAQWTASGGPIGPSNGAIIYDTSVDNLIIGFIEFNPPRTQASGGIFTIANIALELS